MSNDNSTSPRVVLLCVVILMFVVLYVQSCNSTPRGEDYSDQQIITFGRKMFLESVEDPDSIEIVNETVLRPGWDGGDFGYSLKYRKRHLDGSWSEEKHYSE